MRRPVFHDVRGRLSRRGAKVWRGVRALVQTPVLAAANLVSRRSVVDPSSTTVVSLTSYQARLRTVHLTIESIGRGWARPSRLILWVDGDEVLADLSPGLRRLQRRGLEILTCPSSLGPHKKYYPYVLSKAKHDAPLVTADDDCIYPRRWLRTLEEAASGSDDIVCFRAHRITFNPSGEIAPYNSWGLVTDRSPSALNFATGVSGTAYPAAFLNELRALGDSFADKCPRADDVWLHYVAVRNGRRIRQVVPRPEKFPDLLSTQAIALHRVNTGQTANDRQITATYSEDVIDALRTESTAS